MNRQLAREVIGRLRVSGEAGSAQRLRSFSPRDWARSMSWLDQSGLALRFWHRLKARGEEAAVPADCARALERSLVSHRERVAAMAEEFGFINGLFESAHLRYAALKGFALIPQYCPLASLRTTYDYDYLLPPDAMDRAGEVLEEAGYTRKKEQVEHPRVYFQKAAPPRSPCKRGDLYSASFPRTIELHDRLWDCDELRIPIHLQDPLGFAVRRGLDPAQLECGAASQVKPVFFWALSEADELVFQILHAFRHILQNWCRLCTLLDIAWLLQERSHDTALSDQFLTRVKSTRLLGEIAGLVFALSADLFGAPVPESLAAATTGTMRKGVALWVGRYGQELAVSNFSGNKYALFLHREFIESRQEWSEIARSALVPLHRPNQAAETTSRERLDRLAAGWKQALYVARRVSHHTLAAARYGAEIWRWERLLRAVR